jgi:uncharacterized protein (DUF427 family)
MSCQAIIGGETIADSDACITTEGNLYFPPDSVKRQYLKPSARRYHCLWKGDAGYYDLAVKGAVVKDAAWYYDRPSKAAEDLKDYVAFDRSLGVAVAGNAAREIKRPW